VLVEDLRVDESIERVSESLGRVVAHRFDDLVGEVSAERRTELGDAFAVTEGVEPCHERILQRGGHRQVLVVGRRSFAAVSPPPIEGAGQLLGEQGDPIGTSDDPLDDLGGKRVARRGGDRERADLRGRERGEGDGGARVDPGRPKRRTRRRHDQHGDPGEARTRRWSSSRVDGSHQCRSSSVSRTGCRAARARNMSARAVSVCSRSCSGEASERKRRDGGSDGKPADAGTIRGRSRWGDRAALEAVEALCGRVAVSEAEPPADQLDDGLERATRGAGRTVAIQRRVGCGRDAVAECAHEA
jgi:hypothetical protein